MQRHRDAAPTPRAASRASSSAVKCRPAVGAATEPSSLREQGLVVGAVLLVGRRAWRRYRAAAACRRARRSPGRAPGRGRRTTASPRRPRLSPRPWRRAGRGSRPCPRRRSGRCRRLRAAWPAARRRASASRRAACAASPRSSARSPRPIRRPVSRAGITLVSLTTSASPGSSRSGRSRTPRSSQFRLLARAAPPAAAPHRAATPAAARCAPAGDRSRTDRCAWCLVPVIARAWPGDPSLERALVRLAHARYARP